MADQELVPTTPDSLAQTDLEGAFPAILVRAGKAACFAADEFFSARISNPHTRTAYAHQVSRFLAWCEDQGLELHQVTPGLAGRFLDEFPHRAPTKNQALGSTPDAVGRAQLSTPARDFSTYKRGNFSSSS